MTRALYKWIEEQFRERVVEPNSRLGKAFSYVKNHWQGLTRFLEVPGVPLDNNVSEQELKPSQRHRKNSLFFRTQAGADVGDVLLSMIRTRLSQWDCTLEPVPSESEPLSFAVRMGLRYVKGLGEGDWKAIEAARGSEARTLLPFRPSSAGRSSALAPLFSASCALENYF